MATVHPTSITASVRGPANAVTAVRALLSAACAGLVTLPAAADPGTTTARSLVAMAAVALALDGVDGWVARRTGTVTAFGARFDMEVDALLILVLSVPVAHRVGSWVLLIGLARYLWWGATRVRPRLRTPVPARRWRKAVAALQGVALTMAVAGVLPGAAARGLLVAALALLSVSFATQAWETHR